MYFDSLLTLVYNGKEQIFKAIVINGHNPMNNWKERDFSTPLNNI